MSARQRPECHGAMAANGSAAMRAGTVARNAATSSGSSRPSSAAASAGRDARKVTLIESVLSLIVVFAAARQQRDHAFVEHARGDHDAALGGGEDDACGRDLGDLALDAIDAHALA